METRGRYQDQVTLTYDERDVADPYLLRRIGVYEKAGMTVEHRPVRPGEQTMSAPG